MTRPRSFYVDPVHPRYYHIGSRCVRRAFLLGKDHLTGKDCSHRKALFLSRLKHLARWFSVEVVGYALMSNHFHLVVRYLPQEHQAWSNEEVALRWCAVFNGRGDGGPTSVDDFDPALALKYHNMLLDPVLIAHRRRVLGSLSAFMKHLKQPFALYANREDGCTGHFFESRFYSGALLTHEDLLSCMAYVDLNPVQAGMARSLSESAHTSIDDRLNAARFDAEKLEAYLAPLWESGTSDIAVTVKHYAEQLNLAIVYLSHDLAELPDKLESWMARLLNRERQKRSAAFFDYD